MQFRKMGNGSKWGIYKPRIEASSPTWSAGSSVDLSYRHSAIKENSIARKFRRLFSMLKVQLRDHPEATDLRTASLAADGKLLKQPALGPDHNVDGLFEVLDGSMLAQWQALADSAKSRSCFWRFVLLQLTVLQADIFKDGIGNEMAEIEVLLEEAAELVDESQP
ncbi:Plastid division protein CDP1 [Abeliophyllum distichum]|uniref:Plastid division protein CDP1 n=1 Tax=Abeliophyllum distichum TaxID=126358 RepID=A0ABD1PEL6_9LAMI